KEEDFGGGNYSNHSRSSQSSREERRKRHEKNKREERHERRDRKEEDRRDELDMGKCKIPSFLGSYKPELYIDWELKVEQVRLMRKRFVPSSYAKDLHNKLQRLYQGSKSVEEYHKEMKIYLLKA
ncbi:hypothetical protein CR513_38337, partial [Mucuna pruriens]